MKKLPYSSYSANTPFLTALVSPQNSRPSRCTAYLHIFALQDLQGRERLEKFLGDCALLGPVRFICITDGAILEAVGSFDNLRYSDLPKGRLAPPFALLALFDGSGDAAIQRRAATCSGFGFPRQ